MVKVKELVYDELSEEKFGPDKGWRQVNRTWIVTNRHVLMPCIKNQETIPDKFIFHLRKIVNNTVDWEPVELNKKELVKRTRVSQNSNIDIAIVQVNDIIKERVFNGIKEGKQYIGTFAVSKYDLPGIIASGWNLKFDKIASKSQ